METKERKEEETVTIPVSAAIDAAAALSYRALWLGKDRKWYNCHNCHRECFLVRIGEEPAPTQCVAAGRNAKWEEYR